MLNSWPSYADRGLFFFYCHEGILLLSILAVILDHFQLSEVKSFLENDIYLRMVRRLVLEINLLI